MRRQFVDTDFGQIHLRTSGAAKLGVLPLVLLHQSPKSAREFEHFIAASGDREIIAPDTLGHGESAMPPAKPHVTIQDYANCLLQALDALGVEKADLFGNHTGALVAAEMARQQPKRIGQIIMISAVVLTPEEQAAFIEQFQPVPLDGAGTRFTRIWESISKYAPPDMSLLDQAVSFAEHLRGGEGYEWGHRAAFTYAQEFASVLPGLAHRITVLNPADLLHEITKRAAPLLQNGEIIDCPGWAHACLQTHPKEIAACVYKILN